MDTIREHVQLFLVTYGMSILGAILILVVGIVLAGVAAKITERLLKRSRVEDTLAKFARHLVHAGIVVFVIIAAIGTLGIPTASLVAVIGAAGLAIGLALQGSLAHFAAGIMLILFKPFKVGDYVEAGGVGGTVEEIQIVNSVLNTPDNRRVIMPNATITGGHIVNYTGIDRRRVDMVFGISYDDDIQTARKVLTDLVTADDRVLKDPEPLIAVMELGDSSVNLVCRPWVAPKDYWPFWFDMMERGKLVLEAAGLTIPFPQRDIHMHQEKTG